MNLDDFFAASDNLSFGKSATKKPKEGLYSEKLELKIGNEYVVRLLPYVKEGSKGFDKTRFEFSNYCWNANGRWTYVQSPRTWGEPCPMTDFYFRAKESDSPSVQAKLKKLYYRRGTYYNVYVVDDPVHPENNGKVKILQAGKQLDDVISKAMSTDPKIRNEFNEEFGVANMRNAILDLSPNGVNLIINVKDQGGFANYATSSFTRRRRDLGLSKDEIRDIHEACFDLTTIDRRFSTDEAAEIFNKTFLGQDGATPAPKPTYEPKPEPARPVKHEESHDSSGDMVDMDELDKYLMENDIGSVN